MKHVIYLMMWLVIVAPTKSMAYQSVLLKGSAGILVDGSLEDWQVYKLPVQKLEYWRSLPHNKSGTPTADRDLSATLQVFTDAEHIYFAIIVTDDKVVFERSVFGQRWWDDAVWIEFDGGFLEITQRVAGAVVVESLLEIAGQKVSVPYLDKAIGVEAAISHTALGYIVEAKVPRQIVQSHAFEKGSRLLLNVSVLDHDDAGIQEHKLSLDKKISPSIVLSQMIHPSAQPENIPRRHPSAKQALPPKGTQLPAKSGFNNQGQFVITLLGDAAFDRLDLTKRHAIDTATILAKYHAATQADKPNPKTAIWTGGLAGILAVQEGHYRIFLNRFRAIQKFDDPYILEWASLYLTGYKRGFARTTLKLPDTVALLRLEEALQVANETRDHAFYFRFLSALYKVRHRAQLPVDQTLETGIRYATRLVDQFGTDRMGQLAAQNRLKYRLLLLKDQRFFEDHSRLAKQEIVSYSENFSLGSDEHLNFLNQIGNSYREVEMAQDALGFYEKMAELAQTPAYAVTARIGMAHVYLDIAKNRTAMAKLREAEKILGNPQNRDERAVLAHLHLTFVRAHDEWYDYKRVREHLKLLQAYLPPNPSMQARTAP